jgi:hypothetical protein
MKRPSRAKDPSVAALIRVMAAGENDAEYDAAIEELETCAATTAQGVRAKRNLERSRQAALEEGDRLTPKGRAMMAALADTIDEGLAVLTRANLRGTTRIEAGTRCPTPGPTPGRGVRRWRPDIAEPLD